ncbi:MAG: hypothetical protein SNJ77_11100 [Cytophagales bacterium]
MKFNHPRNALNEIWTSPKTSRIFPKSVWFYLNDNNPSKTEKSYKDQFLDKWVNHSEFSDLKKKNKEKLFKLFLGEGGVYTAEDLIIRANMLDQIEALINLMKQDLKLFAFEFEELNNQ